MIEDRNKQAAALLQGLAGKVAALLAGWSHVLPSCDVPAECWARVAGPDGAGLHFHLDAWKKRVRISGDFPQNYHPYGKSFEITVAQDRPAAAVAKEIERRLFPEYLPAVAAAIERKAAAERQVAEAAAVAAELGALIGTKPAEGQSWHGRSEQFTFRHYGSGEIEGLYIEAEVSLGDDHTVEFKIHSCALALARELLRTVRRFAGLPEAPPAGGPLSARTLWEE